MKLAFCLFEYFPYGGLQRDFLRIAKLCLQKGHQIDVYTMQWTGDKPNLEQCNIHIIEMPKIFKHSTNHNKALQFSNKLQNIFLQEKYDLTFGFNKIPGLDLYYCADSCYVAKVDSQKTKLIKLFYKLTARFRQFKYLEHSVFANQKTKILFLSDQEKNNYQQYYHTPDDLCYLLPPNINKSRFEPITDQQTKLNIKQELSKLLNIPINTYWLLMVGSGFRTKGVDRSITLLKYLAEKNIVANLIIIGQDDPSAFLKLAKKLGVQNYIKILPGRDDIAKFMAVADVLLHPAYRENTGTVILESIIMGLPVIASGICGYSHHISDSGCGLVIQEPFNQNIFNTNMYKLLEDDNLRAGMSGKGLEYRNIADIYNSDDKILELIECQ